jgi:hypothetical protein
MAETTIEDSTMKAFPMQSGKRFGFILRIKLKTILKNMYFFILF